MIRTRQELLDYIKSEVDRLESDLLGVKHVTNRGYLLAMRETYLNIYDRVFSAPITDDDKDWADDTTRD
jgi:hypothetical protein